MERRYDLLAECGMRDITGYNAAVDRGELDGGPVADVDRGRRRRSPRRDRGHVGPTARLRADSTRRDDGLDATRTGPFEATERRPARRTAEASRPTDERSGRPARRAGARRR